MITILLVLLWGNADTEMTYGHASSLHFFALDYVVPSYWNYTTVDLLVVHVLPEHVF